MISKATADHSLAIHVALVCIVLSRLCVAGNVVLLDDLHSYSTEEKQLQQLATFEGLDLQHLDVHSAISRKAAVRVLKSDLTLSVLIPADALATLDSREILAAVRRPEGKRVPILIFGILPGETPTTLRQWSGGSVRECAPPPTGFRPDALAISASRLAKTLAGWRLPAVASPLCNLTGKDAALETIIAAHQGRHDIPVLARVGLGQSEVFFSPELRGFDTNWVGNPRGLPKAFSSLAPFIFFLHYAAGDHIWHLDGHYANLTIDDAWLTQPYGHVDYLRLLRQMQEHNFHTTIAFVPWNFDRSEPAVAALFRANKDRYSICIHGNNHAHQEFGDYLASPLPEQAANIRQAIARMEAFRQRTGIPYDRFMVFPHSVAPQATFASLKTYGFLGTANSLNVPLGISFPADPEFLLRPYTMNYGGLLSLFRYSAEDALPRTEVAIHSFLGNPILFYGHQQLFDQGIEAFDDFADLVNRIQPDTKWVGLGDMARHLHLIRARDDGGVDVEMLSDEMELTNVSADNKVFYVQRSIDSPSNIRNVFVNGAHVEFQRNAQSLLFQLSIPGRDHELVRIIAVTELKPTQEAIRKTSWYVWALRLGSDFRDLELSRSKWGQVVVRIYYAHKLNSIELMLENRWSVGAVCLCLTAIAGTCIVRRRLSRANTGKAVLLQASDVRLNRT